MPCLSFAEPATKESIRQMMIETGSGDLGIQIMNQMIPNFKEMMPEMPEEFWQDFMAKVDANQIIELTIPVYQKYLTEKDVKELNAFYSSAIGKKLIRVMPAITQETMQIGRKWGEQLGKQVYIEYEKRNTKKP